MKKICVICGYSIENRIKECPNCGSFDFKTIKKEDDPCKTFRRYK